MPLCSRPTGVAVTWQNGSKLCPSVDFIRSHLCDLMPLSNGMQISRKVKFHPTISPPRENITSVEHIVKVSRMELMVGVQTSPSKLPDRLD